MATNLAIDTAAVEELMRLGSFASKREATDAAVLEAFSLASARSRAVTLWCGRL